MKRIFILLALFAIAFTSCEGDQGPIGPEGPQGPAGPPGDGSGEGISATVFQETANFDYYSEDNNWVSQIFEYNDTVDGDIFLVYLNVGDGVYSPLPISFFDEGGTYQYEFNHDASSVQVVIEGNNDLSDLAAESVQNVSIRVAIIPAILSQNLSRESFTNFELLMNELELNQTDIQIQ